MQFTSSPLKPSPTSAGYEALTVVVPTLNEVGSIGELLDILRATVPGASVIVADDGSRDGTREAVTAAAEMHDGVALLDRSFEPVHGITASVLDAVRACRTTFVAVIDADLQHPPGELPAMFAELAAGASIVIGSRASIAADCSRLRAFASDVGIHVGRRRLRRGGLHVSDPLSGFFAARTELLKKMISSPHATFELRGYKVLFDLLKVLAFDPDCSADKNLVKEIFYHFGARRSGESKLRIAHIWHFVRAAFLRVNCL